MKNRFLLILFFFLFSVATAGAASFTVTDTIAFNRSGISGGKLLGYGGNYVNEIEGFGDRVAWEHHYSFEPDLESITYANLTLSLRDDRWDSCWFSAEFAFGFTEGGNWALGEVDTGDYSFDLNLRGLEDGRYYVALVGLGGDFYIDSSELFIRYEGVDDGTGPAPVPEPATMVLLGIGLVGIAGVSRKKKLKR